MINSNPAVILSEAKGLAEARVTRRGKVRRFAQDDRGFIITR